MDRCFVCREEVVCALATLHHHGTSIVIPVCLDCVRERLGLEFLSLGWSAECQHCGTWTCGDCGWQRKRANLHFEHHACAKCLSTRGTMRPARHRSPWTHTEDGR